MKRYIYCFVCLPILAIIFTFATIAQPKVEYKTLKDMVPVDPEIIKGQLPNGLTYYIKENKKPENRAEFMMVTKIGSVLEDDDQKGLAHFCEHIAFEGTKAFPKNDLTSYLESIGMRWGADLNAFTNFDQTVYFFQLPMDDKEKFEKGFNILLEWAHNVSYADSAIDKERGVVVEEWRLGRGADDRIAKKHDPKIYYNSRYAEREVIGDTSVLLHCNYEALKRFYKDWYRPDLMAIVAVGDFNKFEIEKKIKEHFSILQNPANERERTWYNMPVNQKTLVSCASDKELSFPRITIYSKLPGRKRGDFEDYRAKIKSELFGTMLSNRLGEIIRKPESPLSFYAYAYEGDFEGKSRVFTMFSGAKGESLKQASDLLLTEGYRVLKHGFTKTELERTKKDLMRNIENMYAEKDKTESDNFTWEYISNFLNDDAIPGITYNVELYKKFLPDITLDEVNSLATEFIKKENTVITISATEKEGMTLPKEDVIIASLDSISKSILEPYIDLVNEEPLIKKKLTMGKIEKETKIDELGVTEWVLNNGVKVIIKPTNFKNDEVLFDSYSPGGTSLLHDSDFINGSMMTNVIKQSGIGDMNETQLEKRLEGKIVNVTPVISDLWEGIQGECSPEDMETMFQLIYLYFNEAKVDNEALNAVMSQFASYIKSRQNNPENNFWDSVQVVSTNRHFRTRPWTEEFLQQINPIKIQDLYYQRFGEAGDFTFFFVGNLEINKFKEFVLTYLANLPTQNRKENWKDDGITYPKGHVEKEIKKGIEKKSYVYFVIENNFEWNEQNRFNLEALKEILDIKLTETLRQKKGEVYGVWVRENPIHYPKDKYIFSIYFGCSPDNIEGLTKMVMDEFKAIKEKKLDESYLTKVKEIMKRELEVNLKDNRFWLESLYNSYQNYDDPGIIIKKSELIDKLTLDDIQKSANLWLNTENFMKFVLVPEKKAK
ncbi:MAG: insulinase family protein [FCB group bacterium]